MNAFWLIRAFPIKTTECWTPKQGGTILVPRWKSICK